MKTVDGITLKVGDIIVYDEDYLELGKITSDEYSLYIENSYTKFCEMKSYNYQDGKWFDGSFTPEINEFDGKCKLIQEKDIPKIRILKELLE